MSNNPPEIRLGRQELRIMKVVWDRGTATVHDVKDTLSRGRKPAYSTILTMMRKLEEKGYLRHEVVERTYVYRPTISREAVRTSLLGDLLERVFEGSPSLLVSSLVEHNPLTEKEVSEIKEVLAERRKAHE
jgi:BlaI family transcriptional regulator, penicillinase repressor